MSTPEQRLIELGIELPTPFPPAANYVACVRHGDLLYADAPYGVSYFVATWAPA